MAGPLSAYFAAHGPKLAGDTGSQVDGRNGPLTAPSGAVLGDDWDDDDDRELRELEDDDDELTADDEDRGDYDAATLVGLENRIEKLREREGDARRELERTPKRCAMKRGRHHARLSRLGGAIDRKTARAERKREQLARKLGITPAMLEAGPGGVEAGSGFTIAQLVGAEEAIDRGDMARAHNIMGFDSRTPGEGEEIRLPFLFDGEVVASITLPIILTPPLIFDFTMRTDRKAYASFEVLGIQVDLNIAAGALPEEQLINLIVRRFGVRGGLSNLLYGPQSVTFGAQMVSTTPGTGRNFSRSLPGIRRNSILNKNSLGTIDFTLRQEIETRAETSMTVQAALIVRRQIDNDARRY